MNIFLTSTIPSNAAQHLDDLRLNKMILETAQLLSQAFKRLYGDNENLYKDTHINHPCSIWARENENNYYWLAVYFNSLNSERKFRTGKDHLSFTKLWPILGKPILHSNINFIEYCQNTKNFTFNCTNYKDEPVVIAYQIQLVDKWRNDKAKPKWTKRGSPFFVDFEYDKSNPHHEN